MQIRPYKKTDEKKVFELWNSNLKNKWPIDREIFASIINSSKNVKNVILEDDKKMLGFISLETAKGEKGSIKLILIDKKYQRKGLGKLLMDFGIEYLKKSGVKTVFLGSGGSSYFWPGIPNNLPSAISFFKTFKFNYFEKDVDLVSDLIHFSTSKNIRFNKEVEINTLQKKDAKKVLIFEDKNFPYWLDLFKLHIRNNEYKNILVAKDLAGDIVGSLLLFGPCKNKKDNDFKWRNIFGNEMGGFGGVGVSKKMRERGIGMAIAIKATEALKERCVEDCYVGWTSLIDWYGKLGYKVWRSYQMAKKKI